VKYYTNKARQAGMTLIELTVVLLVLIGLSGLLIPYVSGFISKTHDSTGATNIAEVNGAMERYAAQYQGYPDGLDSLINATGTTAAGEVYGDSPMGSSLAGGDLLMGPRCIAAHTLTMGEAMTLTMSGVDNVVMMNSDTADATFDSAELNTDGTPVTQAIAADAIVATLAGTMNCVSSSNDGLMFSDSNLRGILTLRPNTSAFHYVVMGVGQNTSMMGKVMMSAPVHFAQSGAMSAKNKYNRFGVVFQVPKQNIIDNKGYCTIENGTGDTAIDVALTKTACTGTAGAGSLLPTADQTVTATSWKDESAGMQARFAGSVMLMPMIEGTQSALQRHYDAAAEG